VGSDIVRQAEYDAPVAAVWTALTDADHLAAWLMPNDFLPVVGHRFTLRTRPAPMFDGIVHAEVLELDPPRRMVWSWVGGPVETTVTFELAPLGPDRTRLELRHAGFEGAKALVSRAFLSAGWRDLLRRRLRTHLDPAASA
jgi:uncharacterized protein YndB with AHSA1/START domain